MPGQDGTGPFGQGAMTGRGLGPCGGGMRRGCSRGFGRGMGFRRGFATPVTLTKDEEKKILEAELKQMKTDKQDIERRLKEIN